MRKEEKGLAPLRRSCLNGLGWIGGGASRAGGTDMEDVVGGLR